VKTIALLDYGAGNLHSLAKALSTVGSVVVESDVTVALRADLLVLPGVGAFGQAARELAPAASEIKQSLALGKPCIGVCLGTQLLFDSSEEGPGNGIGLIPGKVRRMNADRLPQMGWNGIEWVASGDSAVARAAAGSRLKTAYFANAFVARPLDDSCVSAWTTHEADRFPSVVNFANTVGLQFHPEKSSRAGVELLRRLAKELLQCR